MQAAKKRRAGPSDISPGWRGYFTAEAAVLLAVLLTGMVAYNREALTRLERAFGPEDNGPVFASYQYNDADNGGTSTVSLIEGQGLSWVCNLTRAYEYGYCGFGVIFDQYHTGRGLDLDRFESISFTLDYEGSSEELRLAVKDKNPLYTELGAPNDEKINQANVAVSPGRQTVSIELDEFSVVEWWREAAKKPSFELSQPRFDNVTSMEFLTAAESEPGRQALRIERIAFNGHVMSAETFFGIIALAWLLLIGSILVLRRRDTERWQHKLIDSMQATLDTIPHMVWSLDEEGRASFNARWQDYTGVSLGTGGWRDLLRLVHPDDARAAVRQWRNGLRSGKEFNLELRLLHYTCAYRWVVTRAVPSRRPDGSVAGWYGTCTDVHERVIAQQALRASVKNERKRSQELKWSSEHDPLTRLPNRRAFEARLYAATIEAEENQTQIGLLLVDMDYFKHINDTLGHGAGDELLQSISARLKQSVRSADFVARIGGDEFAVILPDLHSRTDLTAVGQQVADTIQQALTIGDHVVRPSASIGGAICENGGVEASDFLKMADAALYALKRSGRGGFRLFESYMLEEVRQAASQLARAREAIVDGSIVAVYQPKISIGRGTVTGFEALLRFSTPDGELGMPDMMAEAFNDYELAAKIGEAMQERVVRDVRGWIDAGIEFGRVAINAAPAEFLRNDYAERLLEILDRNGVPPTCIEVEVTEHAFAEMGWEYVARALDCLKAVGVTIALDDFGTGHSSLSHIRDFPVDLIKIDRSYTRLMTEDSAITALVTGLVHLACSLSLEVVAEGVETEQQLELLRVMGCHFAQGHLLGLPLKNSEVGRFTKKYANGKAPRQLGLAASSRAA